MNPHEVLILSQQDVTALLPMQECIEVMAEALGALSRGEAHLPLRSLVPYPDGRGLLAVMPGFYDAVGALGAKVITVVSGNEGTAFDSHQGAVLLFEARHGSLRAILDGSAITAIRTAAVSAVATRALARPDAGDLALLGSGVQAARHLEAMKLVRRLRRVRVWSRDPEHARRFAAREGARHGLAIEAVPDAREAVAGADLVCTVTSSRTPVLAGAWLSPGAHVNAVGAALAAARELDTEAVRRARLFVDRRESAEGEAGDYLIPLAEGAITPDHLRGELGEVLLGRVPGRTSADEITVFKSLGLAIEDLAAAEHVNARARATGRGLRVELGGLRDAAAPGGAG
ncbi:ornithine cyclodeaminase family protein [Anaeromyxobacter terrae]|uniref:ornithine cyclodeaminase family protein n=1 Tax=Anaeromyxobacter terrae TaxID=2925406 RepID=UPI001F58DDAA|nr:ornithine cyclodeaminase family protein [Anaeromyxobacter sp. SG22]